MAYIRFSSRVCRAYYFRKQCLGKISGGVAAVSAIDPLGAFNAVSPFSRGRMGTLPLVDGETPP
jgi:hypothetical protein